eukprot:377856-Rhodomonas_salina.2
MVSACYQQDQPFASAGCLAMGSWDTSQVTDRASLFDALVVGNIAISSFTLSTAGWDTSAVTDMLYQPVPALPLPSRVYSHVIACQAPFLFIMIIPLCLSPSLPYSFTRHSPPPFQFLASPTPSICPSLLPSLPPSSLILFSPYLVSTLLPWLSLVPLLRLLHQWFTPFPFSHILLTSASLTEKELL